VNCNVSKLLKCFQIINLVSKFKICACHVSKVLPKIPTMLKIGNPRKIMQIIFRVNFLILHIQRKTSRIHATYDFHNFLHKTVIFMLKEKFSVSTLTLCHCHPIFENEKSKFGSFSLFYFRNIVWSQPFEKGKNYFLNHSRIYEAH